MIHCANIMAFNKYHKPQSILFSYTHTHTRTHTTVMEKLSGTPGDALRRYKMCSSDITVWRLSLWCPFWQVLVNQQKRSTAQVWQPHLRQWQRQQCLRLLGSRVRISSFILPLCLHFLFFVLFVSLFLTIRFSVLFQSMIISIDSHVTTVEKRKGIFLFLSFFFFFYLMSFHLSDIRLILQLSC